MNPAPLLNPATLYRISLAASTLVQLVGQDLGKKRQQEQLQAQAALEELRQAASTALQHGQFEHAKEMFERMRQKELEVIELQFQNQLELTKHSARVWQQEQQFLRALESFPLKLIPEQVYEAPESLVIIPKHGVIPAFDGPLTNAAIDPSLLARIQCLDADLSWFLQQSGYRAGDPIHGTRFLPNCWSNHGLSGQTATVALHSFLKGRATLFTEYQALDNEIWFNVAYWGLGDTTYNYFTVATFPFHPAEGLVVHRRLFALQALAAGCFADMQAIARKAAPPRLPPRLPTILGDAMDAIIEREVSNVLRGYIRALRDRAETAPDRAAQLALDIATQLAQGARESHAERFLQHWAQQFLAASLQMFLEYRGGDPGGGLRCPLY